MLFFHENPFARIIIPFVAGILIYDSTHFSILPALIILVSCFILVVLRLLYAGFVTYKFRWIDSVIIFMLFLSIGFLTVWYHNIIDKAHKNITIETGKKYVITATITSNVAETRNAYKTIITTEAFYINNTFIPHREKIVLYLPKDSIMTSLQSGLKIILEAVLQEIPEKPHPFAFDYKKYLARTGIRYISYVSSEKMSILGYPEVKKISFYAHKFQQKILQILRSQLSDPIAFGVAAALVTGYRDALDIDYREMFANAGAMHIMCVSGLHVGILYLFLSFILKLLPLNKRTRLFRYIEVFISLLIIWLFAHITGLAPSVTRASLMFSFIAIGKLSEHKMPIFNSIAASAFIILLFDPYALFSVGFQLSYLAVIGIVTIYPILKQWFYVKQRILRYILDIILVSIAAQLITTPISLYYFHQFPNYFILSNLVAIPLATAIMITVIPLLFLYSIPFVGSVLKILLIQELKILTLSVDFIQSLPGATLQNIYISESQVILLYGAIAFLSAYAVRRMFYQFAIAATCLIVFFSISSIRSIQSIKHHELIIPASKQIWFAACSDNTCYISVPEKKAETTKLVARQFKTYFARYNIKKIHVISPDTTVQGSCFLFVYPFVYFHDRHIMFLTQIDRTPPVKPDYVLFTSFSEFKTIRQTNKFYTDATLIVTADNKQFNLVRLKKFADVCSIRIHTVRDHGPLIIK